MSEIEASDIQLFILIPMLIEDEFYRMLDPDELVDQHYMATIQKQDKFIHSRTIPELYQPLFLTEDFKAVFRPAALDLTHIGPEQGVQAIVPSLNIVVQLKWNVELMCNLALLTLEIHMPPFSTPAQINDLLEIVQRDTFSWDTDESWLVPHRSIGKMLDVAPDSPLGLNHLIPAFKHLLNSHAVVLSQNPFITFLLQLNLKGGDEFARVYESFGEYLLKHRFRHLATVFAYHEDQAAFLGNNWRCGQNLESCGWFEWQPPEHRTTPLSQNRYTTDAIFTSSMQRRRAARRIFKIATLDYTAARLIEHLLAGKGETSRLRAAIHDLWRNRTRSNALYYDVLFKLSRLEARYMLLNNNIVNPDWILENPFGEGNSFAKLMGYIQNAFGISTHLHSLREQLDLFNRMLDRCQ